MNIFNKIKRNVGVVLGIFISGLLLGSTAHATVFPSQQVGTGATQGYVLQTNGVTSTWVATSTLGLGGGGGGVGSFNATGSTGQVLIFTGTSTGLGYANLIYTSSTGQFQINDGSLNFTQDTPGTPNVLIPHSSGAQGIIFRGTANLLEINGFNDYVAIPNLGLGSDFLLQGLPNCNSSSSALLTDSAGTVICGTGIGGGGSGFTVANASSGIAVTTSTSLISIQNIGVVSTANNSASGGIDFSAATGSSITGVLHSLALSQFTGNIVNTFNTQTGAATYVVSCTSGCSAATTTTSTALTINFPSQVATTTVTASGTTLNGPSFTFASSSTVLPRASGTAFYWDIVNTGPWAGTWQGVNSTTFYLATNPSGYISGNQNITLIATGDATGTNSGTTSITHNLTITGLNGKALPALATGTLQYVSGAWKLNIVQNALGTYDANGNVGAYGGASACAGGQAVTTISAIGGTTCSAFLTGTKVDSLNSITGAVTIAGTANQIILTSSSQTITASLPTTINATNLNLSGTLGVSSTITQTGGLVSIASTTINGNATTTNLTVTSNALIGGTLNVSSTSNLQATTTVGICTTNCQFTNNPTTVKSYVAAGSSTIATTVGGTLAYSATSTGNGAAASTSIETYNIPTSTYLTIGDEVDMFFGGTFASTAATNKQVQIQIASTTVFDTGAAFAPANTACNWFVEVRVMANKTIPTTATATTTFQAISQFTDSCVSALTDDSGDAGNATFTATTTAPINITVFGNGTNASDTLANYARYVYSPF